MQVSVDKKKLAVMVHSTLTTLDAQGAHPIEVVLALSECVGRTIVAMRRSGASEIAQREMVDYAIKQMAAAIEAGQSKIITQ